MTRKEQLKQLAIISNLILDARLAALHVAAREKAESQRRLDDLDPKSWQNDLPLAAAAQAQSIYQAWVDVRRRDINHALAQQTAKWSEARDIARHAFGHTEALRMISEKLR